MQSGQLAVHGSPRSSSGGLDFVGLAKAMGCAGARVERAEDLAPALQNALQSPGPFMLDVAVR